jgi:hypothetical protein
MSIARRLRRLIRNRSGVAMTEFALGAPFLLMAGLWGIELANYALVNMKIGQLAVHAADNASRVGDASVLQDRKVYEDDISDVMAGLNIHGGKGVNLLANGRVMISSVEIWDPDFYCADGGECPATSAGEGEPFIHWQRCRGSKAADSVIGRQGEALPDGAGPSGQEIVPEPGDAFVVAEIDYEYQPLISAAFIPNREIRSSAVFVVRDDRDLSRLYAGTVPPTENSCTA